MVGSLLSSTYNWSLTDNNLSVVIQNKFEQMQLRNNAQKIGEYLSRLYGHAVTFEVNLEIPKTTEEHVELPLQVQIIKDTFKGSLMGSR